MNAYYGTTGLWYKNGTFYELQTTHVDFFLQKPRLLGFTKKEKEELCAECGLAPGATTCAEGDPAREKILAEVLKKGAIRIRSYRERTSVQCWDRNDKKCWKQLKNCVLDGWDDAFWGTIVAMDCKGWEETVSDLGFGTPVEEFLASSKRKKNYLFASWDSLKLGNGPVSNAVRKRK